RKSQSRPHISCVFRSEVLFFFQSQARNEVFWQRPDPKIRVGMLRTEVGALFRTGTIRLTPDLPLSTPIKLPEWPAIMLVVTSERYLSGFYVLRLTSTFFLTSKTCGIYLSPGSCA